MKRIALSILAGAWLVILMQIFAFSIAQAQVVEVNGKKSANDVRFGINDIEIKRYAHVPIGNWMQMVCFDKNEGVLWNCDAANLTIISDHPPCIWKRKDGSWQIEFLP